MSSPLQIAAEELRILSDALDRLTAMRLELGVEVGPYGPRDLGIGDNVIAFSWNEGAQAYIIDDRIGS